MTFHCGWRKKGSQKTGQFDLCLFGGVVCVGFKTAVATQYTLLQGKGIGVRDAKALTSAYAAVSYAKFWCERTFVNPLRTFLILRTLRC